MKKKLHFLYFLPILLIGFLFNSCEKKYYTTVEDPSANWDVIPHRVEAKDWKWNANQKRYECTIDLNGKFANVDEFIYNQGVAIGYVYTGTQYVDETQNILPFYDDQNGANIWFDTAIQGDNRDFTVCYYYQWSNGGNRVPPAYNFKLALVWRNMNK